MERDINPCMFIFLQMSKIYIYVYTYKYKILQSKVEKPLVPLQPLDPPTSPPPSEAPQQSHPWNPFAIYIYIYIYIYICTVQLLG